MLGGDRKMERLGETEEAGWGRTAEAGRAPGERAACLSPGGPRDSKSEPLDGTREEWVWRPQANAMKVAPAPPGA